MRTNYKYTITLLAALTAQVYVHAQNVKVQDANFKKALVDQGIDTNGDGEIQVEEAKKVTRLYVNNAGIGNLIGIKSFTNLVEFGFYENKIRVLDLEGMTSLRSIYGFLNQLESINVKGLINLEDMYLHQNKIRTFDVSGLKKLKELKMDENNLFKIDLGSLPALEKLELQKNLINEFKTGALPALKEINLSNNYLSSIDLTSFKKLEEARLSDNPDIKKLEIRGLRSLKLLRCYPNNIANLNMSGTVSLQELEW